MFQMKAKCWIAIKCFLIVFNLTTLNDCCILQNRVLIMHYSFAMKSLLTFIYFTLVSIHVKSELQTTYITNDNTFKINIFNKTLSVPLWNQSVKINKNLKKVNSSQLERTFDSEFLQENCLNNFTSCGSQGKFLL